MPSITRESNDGRRDRTSPPSVAAGPPGSKMLKSGSRRMPAEDGAMSSRARVIVSGRVGCAIVDAVRGMESVDCPRAIAGTDGNEAYELPLTEGATLKDSVSPPARMKLLDDRYCLVFTCESGKTNGCAVDVAVVSEGRMAPLPVTAAG